MHSKATAGCIVYKKVSPVLYNEAGLAKNAATAPDGDAANRPLSTFS